MAMVEVLSRAGKRRGSGRRRHLRRCSADHRFAVRRHRELGGVCHLASANAAALNYGARTVAAFGWAAVSRHNIIWQSVAPVLAVLAVLAGGGVAGVFVAYAFSETCLALVILAAVRLGLSEDHAGRCSQV